MNKQMTFTEYLNQGEQPVWHPHVEIRNEDINHMWKHSGMVIIELNIHGKLYNYYVKNGDPCLITENGKRSVFHIHIDTVL